MRNKMELRLSSAVSLGALLVAGALASLAITAPAQAQSNDRRFACPRAELVPMAMREFLPQYCYENSDRNDVSYTAPAVTPPDEEEEPYCPPTKWPKHDWPKGEWPMPPRDDEPRDNETTYRSGPQSNGSSEQAQQGGGGEVQSGFTGFSGFSGFNGGGGSGSSFGGSSGDNGGNAVR